MLDHMKQILVQLDEPLARRLEKLVPGSSRKRSEFIRDAIERALLDYADLEVAAVYARQPLHLDVNGWPIDAYSPPALRRALAQKLAREKASLPHGAKAMRSKPRRR